MAATLGMLTIAVALTGPGETPGDSRGGEFVHLRHCLVSLIDEVEVPAQEAGVLVHIEAREGLQVRAKTRLAQIEDAQVQTARKIASIALKKAREQLKNDIEVRYARAASKVEESEYLGSVAVNKKQHRAVSSSELRRQMLAYRRAELGIEKAEFDEMGAQFDADTRVAELEAAEIDILRRHLVAPINGVIVEVYKHAGEWVDPGDPVMRIVGMERLRVEGFVNAVDHGPQDIDGQPVHVRVRLEGGRVEVFSGKIVFTNPIVQAGGEYRVWAEVKNRRLRDKWILRPGLEAEMAVQLNGARPLPVANPDIARPRLDPVRR